MKAIDHLRREFEAETVRIPYNVIIEQVSVMHSLFLTAGDAPAAMPDRYDLYFSEADRNIRLANEDFFISELVHDIRYLQTLKHPGKKAGRIEVRIHTEKQLEKGMMRIDCFAGGHILRRIESRPGSRGPVSAGQEWNAMEILADEPVSGNSILVVDDEPVLCSVLQRMLSKLGYHVITANNGMEALQIFSHMKIDLVITDLRMPKMDGWELMQRIKKISGTVPVVLITGYHSMYSRDMAEDSMADGYISKPFSFVQIKQIVEALFLRMTEASPAGS